MALLHPPPPDLVVLSGEGASRAPGLGVAEATSKVFTIVIYEAPVGLACAKLFVVIVMMRRYCRGGVYQVR